MQQAAVLNSVDASCGRQGQRSRGSARKTFSLHIGADLKLPTPDSKQYSRFMRSTEQGSASEIVGDPFEGLPFKALADRMGEAFMPVAEANRQERRAASAAAHLASPAVASVLPIPHFLPFTRWAQQTERFKSTFIADDPKSRKKARLSWYHPDDTMVPRGWWKMGLLEDLKYYRPFQPDATAKPSRPTAC